MRRAPRPRHLASEPAPGKVDRETRTFDADRAPRGAEPIGDCSRHGAPQQTFRMSPAASVRPCIEIGTRRAQGVRSNAGDWWKGLVQATPARAGRKSSRFSVSSSGVTRRDQFPRGLRMQISEVDNGDIAIASEPRARKRITAFPLIARVRRTARDGMARESALSR